MPEDIQVVPHGMGWDVTTQRRKTAIKRFTNKQDAIEHARELALRRNVDYVIQRKDGTLQNTKTPVNQAEKIPQETRPKIRLTPTRHVRPWGGRQWAITSDAKDMPTEVHRSKYRAVSHAKRLAREHDAEVVVHHLDGSEQARWNPREEWRPTMLYLGA